MAPNHVAQASVYEMEPQGSVVYQGDDVEKAGRSLIPRNGPMRLKGYSHARAPFTVSKYQAPHFFRKPGLAYHKTSQHRHRDVFDRIWTGDYDDRYLSPFDGRVSKLVVQATDDIYENNVTSTYRRTFIVNVAPMFMRLANWPFNHIDYSKTGKPTSDDYPMLCLKWFVASCVIPLVISTPFGTAEGQVRNGGGYDVVPYQYYGYPKVAKNVFEMDRTRSYGLSQANPVDERILRPRVLCFLRDHGDPALVMNVEEWISQYKSEAISYIFIAYTAEQFKSTEDMRVLHQIADAAARNAGAMAYWVGCSCMNDASEMTQDVYRICDVIRGAQSLAIAVGRPPNDTQGINTTELMLQQWGQRVWTFPEVLLAPKDQEIRVYTRGKDLMQPISVAKNQFAVRVWKGDAHVARQLVDHYQNTCMLNQLELVTLALECLHKRQTTEFLPGDHSYALMGLLRVRPRIDPTDSAFQAFARLSLANGSEQLLERLISVLPKSSHQPWHAMDDAFEAKLWDILPQDVAIAGIGDDDTIILDGCRAANVRWKSFAPVACVRKPTLKRWIASKMLRAGGIVFLFAIILLSIQTTRVVGAIILVYSIILMGLSPWLLRMLYLGKFWDAQCWLFGFEGYLDIDTIECQIFGGRMGRMKWTPAASPLSRHRRNDLGECVPVDPTSDPEVAALVEKAKYAGPGDQRLFTLVDTGNMTATLFLAERPPVCFLMSGSEGGMKRMIGCSYDWTTSTFYRETVIRMETRFEDAMKGISRVKIGFKREQQPYGLFDQVGEAQGQQMA